LRTARPGTELVAYVMNNYWHTNFKADQPGPVTFRMSLIPHDGFDAARATRAGLFASVPPQVGAPGAIGAAFLLDNAHLVVTALAPTADGAADLVRLWNPGADAQSATIRWNGVARRVMISGPDGAPGTVAPTHISVPPHSVITLRVERLPIRDGASYGSSTLAGRHVTGSVLMPRRVLTTSTRDGLTLMSR
ncbi:MAG: hypothetical protein P3B98_06210, partial [Gemmatimonadota bacterium]|nr:hypothetical protein [Gemmatimonadota bacterium]